MNRNTIQARLVRSTGVWLVLAAWSLAASAQTPTTTVPADAPPASVETLRIGDATRQLLSLQRSASGPDRPIPGEQAGLSYRRYLDTFKHPIPQRMGSNISSGGGDKAP